MAGQRRMKPRSRRKHKGRSESGTFTAIPHHVQDSDNWRQASGTAIKLLCDIARQYNGRNNGDLCASLSVLKRKGWTSPETITFALRELKHFGFITLTRQGGPLPWPKPLCVDLAPHPRMRREARLCGDGGCIGRVESAETAIHPANEKTQALYAIRSRPLRQPYRQPGKDTMTATPSVSKTAVFKHGPATPSVHLYRFLPSGSVFVPVSGCHCSGVSTVCALCSDAQETAHTPRRCDD